MTSEPVSTGGGPSQDPLFTLSQADRRASRSAMRVSAWERTMSAGAGRSCATSSPTSGAGGSSSRTCPVCTDEVLTLFSATSLGSATEPGPTWEQLVPLVPHTHVSACSLLPTPLAKDAGRGGLTEEAQLRREANSRTGLSLPEVLGGPTNPPWVEWLMGFPVGWTELPPSETP